AIDPLPALTGVARPVKAAKLLRSIDGGIEARGVARRHTEADASQSLYKSRKPLCQGSPRRTAIGGLVEPTAGTLPGAVLPRPLPGRPQVRVHDLRIRWIESQSDCAGVFVFIEAP